MLKIITSLVFLCFSKIVAAQIYIGYTQQEVRNHMEGSRIVRKDFYADGSVCWLVEFKDVENVFLRRYFFDKTDTCFLYILEPMTHEALVAFVKQCHKNYVTKSDKQWTTYQLGKTIDIHLHYDEQIMQHFFYFRPLE